MRIDELVWDEANIEHVARHNVTLAEIEEAVFDDRPVSLRARHRRYAIYACTIAGRYVVTFIERAATEGRGGPATYRPVTARDMTESERRRYRTLT